MADVRISDATTATTGTVYVPGGAGGAPLKVATTAAGRALMGAADAAAQRAALGLDAVYPRLADDNSLSGANTFDGAVTATAGLTLSGAGGLALRVPAPSGTSGRYFTVSSAYNTAHGGDDEATFIGHNYDAQTGANRGRIDATRGAATIGIESMYKAYTGAPYQDEYYFQTVTPDNKVYRSFMSELRHDGTAANYLGGNTYFTPVIDNDVGVGTPDWAYDANNGSLSSYGKVLVQRTNNVGWLQQWDSTGTPQSLIYLDGSNVTQVGSAGGTALGGTVRSTWTTTNASGLTLLNAVPIRWYDSGGANPINVLTRNSDGTITLGASGSTAAIAARTTFAHTPSYNTDATALLTPDFTGASSTYSALRVAATVSGTNTDSVHYLGLFGVTVATTANSPTLICTRAAPTAAGASAFIPDVTGFDYQSTVSTSAYIADQYGFRVRSPIKDGGSYHSANFYGFKCEDITGPTNPYSIHTGAGWVRLGDATANTRIGFYGATPVVKPAALTAANAGTLDTGDATSDAVIGNMRTRIGELEARLQSLGLLT